MHEPLSTLDSAPLRVPSLEPVALARIPAAGARLPGWAGAFREQLRTVGLSLKREMLGLAGLMGVFTAAVLSQWSNGFTPEVDLSPPALVPIALLGLFGPLAVWKSEGPGRRGYHRAMPVDHVAHALLKTGAGAVWALAAAAGYAGWMVALVVVTGGDLESGRGAAFQWLGPLVGGAALYLLASAVALVARQPWRWLAGGLVGWVLVHALSTGIPALRPIADLASLLWEGPLGLLTVLTGEVRTWSFPRVELGAWLLASGLWLAGAAGALVAALHRQPEE